MNTYTFHLKGFFVVVFYLLRFWK